ncbi:MAG TPA: helix-turn-helix domain-containing protein [Conexibacter sp.]|nr:helix-turn-helix domain-containing protein [Conexibacter sp.]
MHRIVVLALDGVMPFELGIPGRVFGLAQDAAGAPLYEVLTCTLDGRPVRADADFAIAVEHGAEAIATADTLVVAPNVPIGPVYEEGLLPSPLADALAGVRPGTRIVSICIATYVLAAAGLLDGRPATTHWRHVERFQRMFPQVRLDGDVLFVDDGDVLTSAGAAAGVDLCLHLLRRDHGSATANAVARRCIVPAWRDGGQAQYVEHPMPEEVSASTAATRTWVLQHLDRPLQLSLLASHAGMSVRTFTRRFRAETGASPGDWILRQRVELARRLLETTELPVERVAGEAGFGTAASLRGHLRATVGVSPTAYRAAFRVGA